jgi:hypothetical protein
LLFVLDAGKGLATEDWVLSGDEDGEGNDENLYEDIHHSEFPDPEHVSIPGLGGQGSGIGEVVVIVDPVPVTASAPVSSGNDNSWIESYLTRVASDPHRIIGIPTTAGIPDETSPEGMVEPSAPLMPPTSSAASFQFPTLPILTTMSESPPLTLLFAESAEVVFATVPEPIRMPEPEVVATTLVATIIEGEPAVVVVAMPISTSQ